MLLLLRNIVAACVIAAAVMAWWYPEPVLVRLELIQWDKEYARLTSPAPHPLGALGQARALRSATIAAMTLEEFIASKTAGHTTSVSDPIWAQIMAKLTTLQASGQPPRLWLRPDAGPWADLPGHFGYAHIKGTAKTHHLAYQRIVARDYKSSNVPNQAAYPLRSHWPWLLGASLGALAFGLFIGRANSLVAWSSAGRGMRWAAVCAVMCGTLVLWPFVFDTVGSGSSYASMVIGGLFLLGALLGIWLFGWQVVLLQDMVKGGNYLAHFTFTPEEWLAFARWEYEAESSQKKFLWLLIFAISVLVGVGVIIVKQDAASLWVFAVLMALMALLFLLAVGLPALAYRRNRRRQGEVYIGKHCVYVNGTVHMWQGFGVRLKSVTLRAKPLPHLLLLYSYLMFAGTRLYPMRQPVTVRIPVPAGQEEMGKQIAAHLQNEKFGGKK